MKKSSRTFTAPVLSSRPGSPGVQQKDSEQAYVFHAATSASVLFDKKWKVQVLCAMRIGSVRLGQLVRQIPGASKKVLTQHLRQLEADGVVARIDRSGTVLHVEYELTEGSKSELLALLDQLAEWGARYRLPPREDRP